MSLSATEETKIALREIPGTRERRAAERRRIAERAIELQRIGLTKRQISVRLGVAYGQLEACLVQYRRSIRPHGRA